MVRQPWMRWQDEKMKIEGVGIGVLEKIEVCHTHQQSREYKMPSPFIFFNYPHLSFHIVSIPLISFVREGKVPDSIYTPMSI